MIYNSSNPLIYFHNPSLEDMEFKMQRKFNNAWKLIIEKKIPKKERINKILYLKGIDLIPLKK